MSSFAVILNINWYKLIDSILRALTIIVPFLIVVFKYYQDRKDDRRIFLREKVANYYEDYILAIRKMENITSSLDAIFYNDSKIKKQQEEFDKVLEVAKENQIKLSIWAPKNISELTKKVLDNWHILFLIKYLDVNLEIESDYTRNYKDDKFKKLKEELLEMGFEKGTLDKFKSEEEFKNYLIDEQKEVTNAISELMAKYLQNYN